MVETILKLSHLAGPAMLALILSVFTRWRRKHREYQDLRHKQATQQTRVVICGAFRDETKEDCLLEFDPLGVFRTIHFGENLFGFIDEWMRRREPGIIWPDDPHTAAHLREMLCIEGSSMILQCFRIGSYLRGDARGIPAYRYVRIVASLVRLPRTNAAWEDLPCALLIEEGMLRLVHENRVVPHPDEKHGQGVLDSLRLVAHAHFEEDGRGTDVFTTPAGS